MDPTLANVLSSMARPASPASLNGASKSDLEEKARTAAKEFEAVFLNTMQLLNIVEMLTDVEQLRVEPDLSAKVVIDESTGIIVMGRDVRVSTVAIAQGNLTVTITQRQTQGALILQGEFYFPLDHGAIGDTPDGWNTARNRGGVAFRGEARDCHRALTHGINFTVGAMERRYQERSALEACRIAQCAHGHVNAGSLRRESR